MFTDILKEAFKKNMILDMFTYVKKEDNRPQMEPLLLSPTVTKLRLNYRFGNCLVSAS